MNTSVSFYQHDLGKPELDAIAEVLAGQMLTTGETVARFEWEFASYLGCRHVLGVTSCTGALHMSLLALGIGPGDEVITTPMTFVATANAILEAGARPVFVDVEPDTGNIDANLIETAITSHTKAILPVHLYGLMCDMRAIRQIADRYNLAVIEDCAHCIEGSRDDIKPGQLSDAACFSFYATKNLTCGEGGAVITNHEQLFEKLRLLRLHGVTKTAADRQREGYTHWDMTLLGWKYNMDNIQAAILLPQMQRIQAKLAARHVLAEAYATILSQISEIRLPSMRERTIHARHLFPIWVDAMKRDSIVARLIQEGIGVVVNYRAIHLLSYFSESFGYQRGNYPNAERIGDECISLPFYPNLSQESVNQVCEILKKILRGFTT